MNRLEMAKSCGQFAGVNVPIAYEYRICSADGASFVLLREPHHTDLDIARAKRYLYNVEDVVALTVERIGEGGGK